MPDVSSGRGQEEASDALARVAEAAQHLEAIVNHHRPDTTGTPAFCIECEASFPCLTIRHAVAALEALRGKESE